MSCCFVVVVDVIFLLLLAVVCVVSIVVIVADALMKISCAEVFSTSSSILNKYFV